jgi:anti-sigma factor RsiW
MTAHRPVTEADLHAYLDGALPPAEAARVAEWLGAHEEEDARVRAWRDDAALLRDAYAEVAVPRFPALAAPRRRIGWAAAGIALLAFSLGTGAGLLVADRIAPRAAPPAWAEAGISAHRVFVGEVRHPVEVAAAEREHLVGWLSKRLGARIEPPDLSGEGLVLLGGRLLPQAGEPAAMLMYEDGSGERFSLLVARRAGAAQTAFRILEEDGVAAIYWIDGALGYILVGDADRARLLDIAHRIHEFLT